MSELSDRFDEAVRLIDEANAGDPVMEADGEGGEAARGLLYGRRMSGWLERVEPDASEAVRLAARAQHIRRWEVPRDTYPMDRRGYHLWRTEMYGFHGRAAGEILRSVGYGDEMVDRVAELLAKKGIKSDAEAQLLEDVICLVFLEHYYSAFIEGHEDDKVVVILQRTWKKMSERGHEHALGLAGVIEGRAKELVLRAVSG